MPRKVRYPKPGDIALVGGVLNRCVPSDSGITGERRVSIKLVPNFRFMGVTAEVPWSVDVYFGQYYVAMVGGYAAEVHKTIPSLILYLHRALGVR